MEENTVSLTADQQAHEARIQAAHERLCAATNKADAKGYWRDLVGSVLGRDPEVTERLERERLERVAR